MSASAFTLSPDSAACTIEMTTDEYLTVTEPRRSRSKYAPKIQISQDLSESVNRH